MIGTSRCKRGEQNSDGHGARGRRVEQHGGDGEGGRPLGQQACPGDGPDHQKFDRPGLHVGSHRGGCERSDHRELHGNPERVDQSGAQQSGITGDRHIAGGTAEGLERARRRSSCPPKSWVGGIVLAITTMRVSKTTIPKASAASIRRRRCSASHNNAKRLLTSGPRHQDAGRSRGRLRPGPPPRPSGLRPAV